MEVPTLPPTPFHPNSADICAQTLKNRTLNFQDSWFSRYPWLHYDPSLKAVLCYTCSKALARNILGLSKYTESAFTVVGYSNWKKAHQKFTSPENSHCHRLAVQQLAHVEVSQPVIAQLSKQKASEQAVARGCLMRIITSLRYLLRQG